MDGLDLGILREMSRQRLCWWGGLDARISSDEIARGIGVSGSTVRGRLLTWQRDGFLSGYGVIPNPALLGAQLAHGRVRVEDPRAKPRLLDDLALVDGVAGSLDQVGPWVEVSYVHETPADLERRRRLVARLAGVDEATPPQPYRAPPPAVSPTPADWRIIAAVRAEPRASVAAIAKSAGMSTRTFTRRYHALVQARALFFMPLLDFSRFTGGTVVRLIVHLASREDAPEVARRIRGAFSDVLELWNPKATPDDGDVLNVLLYLETAGLIEDAVRTALEIPGVRRVESALPRRWRTYPQWFDDRLARLEVAPVPRTRALEALAAPPS